MTGLVAGIALATGTKLLSSADDVLWLAPFMTPTLSRSQRVLNSVIYLSVYAVQTVIAYALSIYGTELVETLLGSDSTYSVDQIMTLIAGIALFIFSIFLGIEYFQDEDDDDNNDNNDNNDHNQKDHDYKFSDIETSQKKNNDTNEEITVGDDRKTLLSKEHASNPSTTSEVSVSDDDEDLRGSKSRKRPQDVFQLENTEMVSRNEINKKKKRTTGTDWKLSRSLIIIAFLGSLDDLALFIPMLVSSAYSFVALFIGASVASCIVLLLCMFLNMCKCVVDILEMVPLAAIVFVFSVVFIIKGLFFM